MQKEGKYNAEIPAFLIPNESRLWIIPQTALGDFEIQQFGHILPHQSHSFCFHKTPHLDLIEIDAA